MRLFKSPEVKGIAVMVLAILGIGAVLLISSGKLETWFGFTWGPRALDRIIYVSASAGSPRIYSISTNGTGRLQLTEKDTKVLSPPAIAPLGNRIAFVGLVENYAQIMVIGGEGGRPEQITATETPKSSVTYNPDGDCLSYIASGRVYVSSIGGDNPDVVLPTEEEEHQAMANPLTRGQAPPYTDFAWGPDGVKMAAVTKTPDGSDMLVYLPKAGKKATRLDQFALNQAQIAGIAWAAKKPVLVASINYAPGGVLAVFDAKTKAVSAGLFKGQMLGKLTISPDGSQIVVPFLPLSRKGVPGLAVLSTVTGERKVLLEGVYSSPVFSPKGDALLAIRLSNRGKTRDLIRIDASTGKVKQLTHDGGVMAAIWSPTSK